jgi:copper chaperone
MAFLPFLCYNIPMEQKTLNVNGMSCDHCVKAVTNALNGLDGVADVVVSLKDKTASFKFDSALTSIEDITKAITEEGFEVTG